MGNTKALEVVRPDHDAAFKHATYHTEKGAAVTNLENLADAYLDLRAQLAEAQKQLAAERAMADRLAQSLAMACQWLQEQQTTAFKADLAQYQATRQPTQDKGE